MEKQRLRKKIKGLSLISLTIAVVILIIISSLLIYNAKNGVKIRAYKMLQNDVQLLEDKVNAYYVKYSAIPAEIEYVNTTLLNRMFNENKKSPNDGEEYYVIDLKALEGVTLNYGKDYENISTEDDTRKYEDVYIINKESHHIYYVKGINFDGKWYYTNENDDEVNVVERKKWVSAVTYGEDKIIALDNRGTLYTTDVNYEGKINENRNYQKLLNVDELKLSGKNIVQISGGLMHTVAIDKEGKVYTWGFNEFGQLGDGTITYSALPICISDKENELKGKRIVDILAGYGHTVAIDEEGKVYTWGFNEFGQLGYVTEDNSTEPICISDKDNELKGKKIISISAGGAHTVAIDEEGKAYTWGYNEFGQLGDGTTTNSVLPICISDKENELKGKRIVDISAGYGHTVAIDEEGKVYTWGNNGDGQLGDGTTTNSVLPICLSNKENELKGKKIISISAGYGHTVAIDEEGKAYTWGYNEFGQLGDGTTTNSVLPICISDKENELKGKRIVDISAGYGHTVAIDEEGKVCTWGDNKGGQLGDGTTTNSVLPICISDKDNELKGKKIISISAGGYHTVAIDKEGKVYTWGDNEVGQLGDGTANDIVAPIYSAEPICLTDKENELKRMKTVKVVMEETVVSLAESGKIYIWEVKDGTAIHNACISDEENELKGKKIVDISAGDGHTVALDEEGKVYTWGKNNFGQLGDGTATNSSLPICISDKENELKGKRIVDISAGYRHTVAIDEEGKAYTWGYNEYGQLGDGTTTNSVLPICISEKENELKGKRIVDISAGYRHTVAIDEEGKVYTWGANYSGQLGDGTLDYSAEPICISNKENELKGKKIINISAGEDHTVALDEEGKVCTWGNNEVGQLGDGTLDYSAEPICISDKENKLKGKKTVNISANENITVVIDSEGYMLITGGFRPR